MQLRQRLGWPVTNPMTHCVLPVTLDQLEHRIQENAKLRHRFWRLRTRLDHQLRRREVSPQLLTDIATVAGQIADVSQAIGTGLTGAIATEVKKEVDAAVAAQNTADDQVGQGVKDKLTTAKTALDAVNLIVNPLAQAPADPNATTTVQGQ